jgi:hypothetical protein
MCKVYPIFLGCSVVLMFVLAAQNVEATVPPYCAPTPTKLATAQPTKTPKPLPTPTRTATPSSSATPTHIATPTKTPRATTTPVLIPTKSPTPLRTATARATRTPVCVPTATLSATATQGPVKTPTAKFSPSETPIHESTPPVPPTYTATATITPIKIVPTLAPTAPPTVTPSPAQSSVPATATADPTSSVSIPILPSITAPPTVVVTVLPNASISPIASPSPIVTTFPTSTATIDATYSPTPDALKTPGPSLPAPTTTPSPDSTVTVNPNETVVTLTLKGNPLCEKDVTFSFECNSSDEEASLAWTASGDCSIVDTEGMKGEQVTITMLQGLTSTPCRLQCTSYSKNSFVEITAERKVLGCELCGSVWDSCQACEETSDGCLNIDRCGICGGDGTSCERCSLTDSNPQQGAVDSAALAHKRFLESMIGRASKLQRRSKTKGIPVTLITAWRELTTTLYTSIWSDIWGSYQGASKSCEVEGVVSQCSRLSNEGVLSRIKISANTMRSLGVAILRALKRAGLETTTTRRLTRGNQAHYLEILKQVNSLPMVVESCWVPEQVNLTCKQRRG